MVVFCVYWTQARGGKSAHERRLHMSKYKLGLGLGLGYSASYEDQVKAIAGAGFDACFTGWSEGCDVEKWANGIARA